MEILAFLENFIRLLERSSFFQAGRFFIGFYLIVILFALVLVLYQLYRSKYYWVLTAGAERPNIRGLLDKRWKKIEQMASSGDLQQIKAAILETSTTLNEILSLADYSGATLGEKLEGMNDLQLANLAQLKEANRIKNLIVGDGGGQISLSEAKETLEAFLEALRFLEAIR